MGVLEQIEILIKNNVINHKEKFIAEFSIQLIIGDPIYVLVIADENNMVPETLYFDTKEEAVEFLNKNGWNIYTENKS